MAIDIQGVSALSVLAEWETLALNVTVLSFSNFLSDRVSAEEKSSSKAGDILFDVKPLLA